MKAYAGNKTHASSVSPFSGSVFEGEEWKLVQRIVATPPFRRSSFLTNFLLYICDRKLSNREDEITEHQIGVQALGRPAAYHAGEDNIVRNYARILRKRLDEYFLDQENDERLRIIIPRGQYVPVFEANILVEPPANPTSLQEPEVLPLPRETEISSNRHLSPAQASLVAVLIIAFLIAGWMYRRHRLQVAAAASPDLYRLFWNELINSQKTTYIVTGDSGFALLQDITGQEVDLPEYVNGDFDKFFPDFRSIWSHEGKSFDADDLTGYTSVADLNAVAKILRRPESTKGRVVVRNARYMEMTELRQANLILLGGPHANPWAELFEPASAFRLALSPGPGQRLIVNKHPLPGEQPEYRYIANLTPNLTYAVVSFLPNIDGNGYALLIEGVNVAGTAAGANFVLNRSAMLPILKKAQMKDGSINCFETLLETQSIGASAPDAHPIIERYGCPAKKQP